MEFPDWVQVKEKTPEMANKSVPRMTHTDGQRFTYYRDRTIVYLYTYTSDKPGMLELNCNTLVKLRYRNGQHYSGILKVSSIARWKGR